MAAIPHGKLGSAETKPSLLAWTLNEVAENVRQLYISMTGVELTGRNQTKGSIDGICSVSNKYRHDIFLEERK